jgi:hypothetical protein
MSFNVKYILPGDDKSQIISKVNQNFSQVYYASVGLQGEKGVVGPTGIIGQVGMDGPSGPTGERANIWIFQDTPPGIYSVYPIPLENYDVWVNTSPTGSTGGLNRIYRYQYDYSGGDYGYFWIDTGSNFTAGNIFSIVQGVSGPGQITDRNAIIAGPTATFVFTDREVIEGNANPTYAKVLVENSGFTSAELPVFGLDKTFYSSSGAPSFKWKDTTGYGLILSSSGDFTFKSQATGSYYSATGSAGVTAGNNINVSSSTQLGVSGPSGIDILTKTLGIKSRNFILDSIASLPNLGDGATVTSPTGAYEFSVQNTTPLASNDNRTLTVLEYNGGPSGGILRPSINFATNGYSLFRINNASSGSYPALSIGYTGGFLGGTGPSGGTGANVYKGYQTVTDSAASKIFFGTVASSNYISITPTNDSIRVVPAVPTGGSISANGRSGRIWLYITNISDYLESSNASEIDIFLDSTAYSIGGVALQTNYSSSLNINGELQITDGGTGPSQGCRHVKINLFGNTFPSTVNNTGNKYAYIQAFVSGNSVSSQVPYYFATIPFTGGFATVICTELYRQGFMSDVIREADQRYGDMITETRPEVMIGYHYWALPIVELMKKSRAFTKAVWFFAKPWSDQMAYEMGVIDRGNWIGKALMEVGIFFSGVIGKFLLKKKLNLKEKI